MGRVDRGSFGGKDHIQGHHNGSPYAILYFFRINCNIIFNQPYSTISSPYEGNNKSHSQHFGLPMHMTLKYYIYICCSQSKMRIDYMSIYLLCWFYYYFLALWLFFHNQRLLVVNPNHMDCFTINIVVALTIPFTPLGGDKVQKGCCQEKKSLERC